MRMRSSRYVVARESLYVQVVEVYQVIHSQKLLLLVFAHKVLHSVAFSSSKSDFDDSSVPILTLFLR